MNFVNFFNSSLSWSWIIFSVIYDTGRTMPVIIDEKIFPPYIIPWNLLYYHFTFLNTRHFSQQCFHFHFLRLLSSRGGGPDNMWGTIWPRTFSPFVIQRRRARWHAGNHLVPHFFTFSHPETAGPMTCGGTLWSHTLFTLPRDNQVR